MNFFQLILIDMQVHLNWYIWLIFNYSIGGIASIFKNGGGSVGVRNHKKLLVCDKYCSEVPLKLTQWTVYVLDWFVAYEFLTCRLLSFSLTKRSFKNFNIQYRMA